MPPVLWWYLYQVSFYLVSAGLWSFYERITYEGGRRVMRRMWQGYALFAVGLVVLDVANLIALPQAKTVYMCLLTASIVVSIVVFIRSPEKKQPRIQYFSLGHSSADGDGIPRHSQGITHFNRRVPRVPLRCPHLRSDYGLYAGTALKNPGEVGAGI